MSTPFRSGGGMHPLHPPPVSAPGLGPIVGRSALSIGPRNTYSCGPRGVQELRRCIGCVG